jgi:hypothetical protein
MEHVWMPSGWTIAGALIVLGAAWAFFATFGEQRRNAQRAVAQRYSLLRRAECP